MENNLPQEREKNELATSKSNYSPAPAVSAPKEEDNRDKQLEEDEKYVSKLKTPMDKIKSQQKDSNIRKGDFKLVKDVDNGKDAVLKMLGNDKKYQYQRMLARKKDKEERDYFKNKFGKDLESEDTNEKYLDDNLLLNAFKLLEKPQRKYIEDNILGENIDDYFNDITNDEKKELLDYILKSSDEYSNAYNSRERDLSDEELEEYERNYGSKQIGTNETKKKLSLNDDDLPWLE